MAKTESIKYPYPDLPAETKDKAGKITPEAQEVLRVRAASGRAAMRDIVEAFANAKDDETVKDVRETVSEALAFVAARAEGRKAGSGDGAPRAPKANVVAEYFKDKSVGEKIDAADVFFDLDMDPARVLSSLGRFVSSVKDTSARVWVSYDKAIRSYVVAGRGESAPEGFTAYEVKANAADVA